MLYYQLAALRQFQNFTYQKKMKVYFEHALKQSTFFEV